MERRVQDKLMQLTDDIDPTVRAAAACALGYSGHKSRAIFDELLRLTGDESSIVKAEAAKALGRLSQA